MDGPLQVGEELSKIGGVQWFLRVGGNGAGDGVIDVQHCRCSVVMQTKLSERVRLSVYQSTCGHELWVMTEWTRSLTQEAETSSLLGPDLAAGCEVHSP